MTHACENIITAHIVNRAKVVFSQACVASTPGGEGPGHNTSLPPPPEPGHNTLSALGPGHNTSLPPSSLLSGPGHNTSLLPPWDLATTPPPPDLVTTPPSLPPPWTWSQDSPPRDLVTTPPSLPPPPPGAWSQHLPPPRDYAQVAVRILLECILVLP